MMCFITICDVYLAKVANKCYISLATASEGLKKLRDNRRDRWRKKPVARDALDDLLSLERKETIKGDLKCSAKAGTSTVNKEHLDGLVTFSDDIDDPGSLAHRPVLPYDVAHPPSPKVSKGPNVKSTKSCKTSRKLSSSEISSDVEIPLSGVVRNTHAEDSSELYSGKDEHHMSTEEKG